MRGVLTLLVFLALMFIPAGRIDWWEGWLFLLFFLVTVSGLALWMRRSDPALAAERTNVAENVEKWDNIIIAIYTVMLFILLILAGLDSGRMNWSTVPLVIRLLGWLGLFLAGAIVWWSMASNTFLSERVRIQDDRGTG
jgi:protein-S-isoprenylcysteine O-methyltransferase Ste14